MSLLSLKKKFEVAGRKYRLRLSCLVYLVMVCTYRIKLIYSWCSAGLVHCVVGVSSIWCVVTGDALRLSDFFKVMIVE